MDGDIERLWDAIRHERELREQYIRNVEANLKLQAAEYERRLDALNHSHTAASNQLRLMLVGIALAVLALVLRVLEIP